MNSLRIALVDWDRSVRAGRKLLLQSQADMQVVFESDGSEADIAQLSEALVDVVVIDQVLAYGSGIDFYRELRKHFDSQGEAPAALLTSAFEDDELRVLALEAAFVDLVGLDSGAEQLLKQLRSLNAPSRWNLAGLQKLLASSGVEAAIDVGLRNQITGFSENRQQILARLRRGFISCASGREVEWNIKDLEKLSVLTGSSGPTELVIRLYRNGYLDG